MQCRRCTRCHAQYTRCRSIGECRSAPRTIRLSFSQLRVLTNNLSGFVHNPFSTPSLSMSMPKFSKVFLVFWMIFLEIFVHTQIRSLTGKINIVFFNIHNGFKSKGWTIRRFTPFCRRSLDPGCTASPSSNFSLLWSMPMFSAFRQGS